MRFGFETVLEHTTWDRVLATWRVGDELDVFESGWTYDHFYPVLDESPGPCLEGWATLAGLAIATHRLRLGVMVSGVHHRHPAILANMAATIDVMCGGRLELGLGAGWNHIESGAYGLPLGPLRDRSDRLEEACEVLVRLLTDERVDFSGRFYEITDAMCEPKGVQRPHLPICIGGNGERRTLRTAARFAQSWNFVGGEVAEFVRKREVLREHCEAIARDPAEVELSAHVTFDASDVSRTVDAAAEFFAAGADVAIVQFCPPHEPSALEAFAAATSRLS